MGIEQDRIIAGTAGRDDEVVDRAVRPKTLADYVGQPNVKTQMDIFIQAARMRGEALDHVLIFGPPGLGKTTLAHIIANELKVNLRQTSGPVLERPGDLAALADQPRAARRAVRRRDSSPESGGRGGAVPGDGGLAARSDDRRGPRGAIDQARPAALHAGRRNDPRGPAHLAAARSLRHRAAAGILFDRGADQDRASAAPRS